MRDLCVCSFLKLFHYLIFQKVREFTPEQKEKRALTAKKWREEKIKNDPDWKKREYIRSKVRAAT